MEATVEELIVIAASIHGVSSATLLRVARCENRNLVPGLVGGSGRTIGIYQWHDGAAAWRSTPYYLEHRIEIFDLYYTNPQEALHQDIMQAAWAFANGKANQWECY